MFVSVVIPTYNRRDSLRVTLDGLARQDFPPEQFEVVVVSDGSTDGTDDLLTTLVRDGAYPFALRPIRQENAGPARARNRGVDEAHGEIIVFMDDDVEPAPACLTNHARHHAQDPQIALIGPMAPDPTLRWSEACWIAWEHAMLEKQYENWRTGVWAGTGPNHFYTGNASVARRHVQAVGGFDETFKRQEDVEMAARMADLQPPVTFAFDAAARGTHRPRRTFDSWRAVPSAYGKLDAIRVRRGELGWQIPQDSFRERNWLTRTCVGLCIKNTGARMPMETALAAVSRLLWRLHLAKPSLAVLSAVYNIRYFSALGDEFDDSERTLYNLSVPYTGEAGPVSS